jgi:(R,R)-butanediol dehydrogenase / meso-butanediol dehydrogenase / diacetyl reductase
MGMSKSEMMKCAVFYGAGDLRIEDRPLPVIGETDVLVEIKACGICGTEVSLYQGKLSYDPSLEGSIIGHETTGVIRDKGRKVKYHEVGDRVVIFPMWHCGECYFCRKGNENLCFNSYNIGGGYAKFVKASQDQVFTLPDNLSFEEGTFLADPVPTTLYALRSYANINPGDFVVIWGLGAQGYSAMQISKLSGGTVIVVGRNENKLKLAKDLGADFIIDTEKENVVKKIKEITVIGADVCIECGGYPEAMTQTLGSVRKGGKVILVSLQKPQILNLESLVWNETQVLGTIGSTYRECILGIKLAQDKKLQLKPLITHVYNLSEINKAFELLSSRKEQVIKVIIKP